MTKRFMALTTVVVVTFASIALVSARKEVRRQKQQETETAPTNETVIPATSSRLPQRKHAQTESEIVTITPHGFEPREITRPNGTFLLMIEDRSGLAMTSLQLKKEAGSRLREVIVRREEPNWSDLIELQPGRYVLGEVGHEDWLCHITITPQ